MPAIKEGFINTYRKRFFILSIIVFVLLWIFTKPFINMPYIVIELGEPIGGILLFFGVLGRIFSSMSIGGHKNNKLIKTEMYSTVRHPLYFFSFLFTVGFGLLTNRPELLIYLSLSYLMIFIPMIKNEEKFLIGKFGQEYKDYMKSVPMFIPNFRKYKGRKFVEINMELVLRTTLDASIILTSLVLIEILEIIKYYYVK